MKLAPHASVEWWPRHEPHGHLLFLGDVHGFVEYSVEDAALELAETLQKCNSQRHGGHGKTHSQADLMDAYRGAVHQLLTRDYEKEWEQLQTNKRLYEMWGGPVPRASLFPDEINPREWRLMVPNKTTGQPEVYEVQSNIIYRDIPPPEEGKTARKGRWGWEAIPPDPAKLPGKGRIGPK